MSTILNKTEVFIHTRDSIF